MSSGARSSSLVSSDKSSISMIVRARDCCCERSTVARDSTRPASRDNNRPVPVAASTVLDCQSFVRRRFCCCTSSRANRACNSRSRSTAARWSSIIRLASRSLYRAQHDSTCEYTSTLSDKERTHAGQRPTNRPASDQRIAGDASHHTPQRTVLHGLADLVQLADHLLNTSTICSARSSTRALAARGPRPGAHPSAGRARPSRQAARRRGT